MEPHSSSKNSFMNPRKSSFEVNLPRHPGEGHTPKAIHPRVPGLWALRRPSLPAPPEPSSLGKVGQVLDDLGDEGEGS